MAAQPAEVTAYHRTHFGTVEITGFNNPFTDLKMSAKFTHPALGVTLAMPVVVQSISGGTASMPIYFTAPFEGEWIWHLAWTAGGNTNLAVHTADFPVSAQSPGEFACMDSSLRGWWRPDVKSFPTANPAKPWDAPGSYRHAVVVPNGTTGGFSYVRPNTTPFFDIANPGWSSSEVANALTWASDNGFNRTRFCLTRIENRAAANNPSAGAANHTVFHKINTTGFAPNTDIDFDRFDLSQWTVIDGIVSQCAGLGMEVAASLVFNTAEFDYEKEYLWSDSLGNWNPQPIMSANSAFQYRHELYMWYVVGRLGAYTNVHYIPMHEWNHSEGGGDQGSGPYPTSVAVDVHEALYDADPYLALDSNWKIVSDNPRRGTMYAAQHQTTSFDITYSQNVSPFLDSSHNDRRSVIGLQRGGELGIGSIEGSLHSLTGSMTSFSPPTQIHPCTALQGHRPYLVGQGNDRPIFIEEDWAGTVDRTIQLGGEWNPVPSAASWNSFDNPYAVYCVFAPGSSGGYHANQDAFPFLSDNWDGLRKVHRDQAWMSGVICHGYTAYWTPKWKRLDANLGPDSSTFSAGLTSHRPFLAARNFAQTIEWWRFTYDPSIATGQWAGQAPIVLAGTSAQQTGFRGVSYGSIAGADAWPPNCTLPGWMTSGLPQNPGRVPFEQTVVAAISDHSPPQYIVYSPACTPEPGGPGYLPAKITLDLSAYTGSTATFTYINPGDGTAGSDQTVAPSSSVLFDPTGEPSSVFGEHHEYVLYIR